VAKKLNLTVYFAPFTAYVGEGVGWKRPMGGREGVGWKRQNTVIWWKADLK